MNQPMVSIGMPCYNVSTYVENAINSILNGSFDDFELVCVDDGSTDSTLEILNRCAEKDSRVKVFHQPNGGCPRLGIPALNMRKASISCGWILMTL